MRECGFEPRSGQRSQGCLLIFALWIACAAPEARSPGERTPLTAACDDGDPTSCLLPWPSSRFTVADPSTATGLRVSVDAASLPIEDDPSYLNRADGFSRVTGLAVGFEGDVSADVASWEPADSLAEDATLRVFVAEGPDAGARVAFRTEWHDVSTLDATKWLLVARPAAPMAPSTEHLAVVLDDVGPAQAAPRAVQVALGLVDPSDRDEEALFAYHAPARDLLAAQGVDPARVVRLWDFTTRSAGDPTFRMHAMMDALEASLDTLGVEIDSARVPADPEIAVIVRGRLTGAPSFLDADGRFVLDDEGRPQIVGTAPIEFRVMVPAGTGDYPIALYGHGTGGDVSDPAFDVELGEEGVAKLALRFDGWTGDDLAQTLLRFTKFELGSEVSTAGLLQALAGGTVLLTAMDGVLDDVLSAETIGDVANPAAGRHPDLTRTAWVGGSMGGTMGAVMVSADDRLRIAVLNVPGAGWTHMVPYSMLYSAGLGSLMAESYPTPLDMPLAIVMSQGSWDEVDGGVWADEALAAGGIFLLQQSMDDPILPNLGTELLANAFGARMLQPNITPTFGIEPAGAVVTSGAAIEQFRVPVTGAYDVHGFAARDTPAGDAAREQIQGFLQNAWNGKASMVHPDLCTTVTATGNCDFSGMWE